MPGTVTSGYMSLKNRRKRLRSLRIPRRLPRKNTAYHHIEYKMVDTTLALAANTTGTYGLINGTLQGPEYYKRIGKQILMKSLTAHITCNVIAGLVDQYVTVFIVVMKAPHGSPPSTSSVIASWNDMTRQDQLGNYIVLKKWTFPLGAAGGDRNLKFIRYYRKLNIPVMFNLGVAGNIADIEQNAIYVFAYGSETAGSTAASLDVQTRITFTD